MKNKVLEILIIILLLMPVVSSRLTADTIESHDISLKGTLIAFDTNRAISIGNN